MNWWKYAISVACFFRAGGAITPILKGILLIRPDEI